MCDDGWTLSRVLCKSSGNIAIRPAAPSFFVFFSFSTVSSSIISVVVLPSRRFVHSFSRQLLVAFRNRFSTLFIRRLVSNRLIIHYHFRRDEKTTVLSLRRCISFWSFRSSFLLLLLLLLLVCRWPNKTRDVSTEHRTNKKVKNDFFVQRQIERQEDRTQRMWVSLLHFTTLNRLRVYQCVVMSRFDVCIFVSIYFSSFQKTRVVVVKSTDRSSVFFATVLSCFLRTSKNIDRIVSLHFSLLVASSSLPLSVIVCYFSFLRWFLRVVLFVFCLIPLLSVRSNAFRSMHFRSIVVYTIFGLICVSRTFSALWILAFCFIYSLLRFSSIFHYLQSKYREKWKEKRNTFVPIFFFFIFALSLCCALCSRCLHCLLPAAAALKMRDEKNKSKEKQHKRLRTERWSEREMCSACTCSGQATKFHIAFLCGRSTTSERAKRLTQMSITAHTDAINSFLGFFAAFCLSLPFAILQTFAIASQRTESAAFLSRKGKISFDLFSTFRSNGIETNVLSCDLSINNECVADRSICFLLFLSFLQFNWLPLNDGSHPSIASRGTWQQSNWIDNKNSTQS